MSNTNKHLINYVTPSSKPIDITHNIYDNSISFKHSLTIDGEEGLKVGYKDIARNGAFCAVTPYYSDYFPEVFMITNFSSIAKRCTSQEGSTIKKTTKII